MITLQIMDREIVDSSMLRSIGYEKKTHTLELEFQSGKIYQYFGVTEPTYQDWMQADSKGSWFNGQIRGAFQFTQVR